jgi:hypothetical protein
MAAFFVKEKPIEFVGPIALESALSQSGTLSGGVAATFCSAGKSVEMATPTVTSVTVFGTWTFHFRYVE